MHIWRRLLGISIHTTTQVVTFFAGSCLAARSISIHTTTQVVTAYFFWQVSVQYISIHTTTQVVTPSQVLCPGGCGFQSTPPRRW